MIQSDNDLSGLEHHGPIPYSLFANSEQDAFHAATRPNYLWNACRGLVDSRELEPSPGARQALIQ